MFIRSLALVTVLTVAGCPAPAPPPSDYELNLAKWQAAGLENYEFDYQLGCFCTDELRWPVHIVVEAGRVIDARYLEDGSPAGHTHFGGVTVENKFAEIESAILDGEQTVEVTYDPDLGYPTRIYMYYEPYIPDIDTFYTITNVTPR